MAAAPGIGGARRQGRELDAVDIDAPRLRAQDGAQQMQQGRFAGAGWPQQQRVLAARQFKKRDGKYVHTAVAVLQLRDGQQNGLDQQ